MKYPSNIYEMTNNLFVDPVRVFDAHTHYSIIFSIKRTTPEKFSVLQEKEYATRQLKMKRIQEGGGYQWHYESMGSDLAVVKLYSNTILMAEKQNSISKSV